MLRIKDIIKALLHVVGWEQSYDPTKAITEEMTESESGLTFQGAHPLVTLDNMRAIMPEDWAFRYPIWSAYVPYTAGQKVRHDGRVWEATIDNVGVEPTSTGDFNEDYNPDYVTDENAAWKEYNELSDFLEHITRNGIAQAITTFQQIKQLDKETRNLLERRTFFDGAGRLAATIENRGKIVGMEITPVRAMGVTTKIEKIGLQMTGGTGKVRMYLFHSSQIDPVQTFDLEFTKTNGGFQWYSVECFLPYISEANNAGGSWYLCYNQDELPEGMQAINVSKDWSREPCGTCNIGSVEAWRELTKYLQISPFMKSAPKTFAEFPEMWDVADTLYTNTQNYGMNVEVSVSCDISDFIISQRQIFASVIQKQIAAMALRTLAMNPDVRVNRNQSNASRMDILYELDGNTQGRPSGLGYELKEAYKALNIDTDGIDRICLSCNNHGVRYRQV